jgi:hypothetical protein
MYLIEDPHCPFLHLLQLPTSSSHSALPRITSKSLNDSWAKKIQGFYAALDKKIYCNEEIKNERK